MFPSFGSWTDQPARALNLPESHGRSLSKVSADAGLDNVARIQGARSNEIVRSGGELDDARAAVVGRNGLVQLRSLGRLVQELLPSPVRVAERARDQFDQFHQQFPTAASLLGKVRHVSFSSD